MAYFNERLMVAGLRWVAIGLLIGLCLVAVGLGTFVPGLPE
jgi:hypothetical protein